MLNTMARFQFFIYPLMVHLSVVYQMPFITASLLPLFYFIFIQPFSLSTTSEKHVVSTKSFIFFLLCLIAVYSYYARNYVIIYLPPVLIMSVILYPFIRSLIPGNTALISRFYQLTEKENKPEKMHYTRMVTWVWVIFLLLLLCNTLFLTFFASLEAWSLFTNFLNYLLMLILFISEWLFRMAWFKQWVSPLKFIHQLITIDQHELLQRERLR